ncbi:MAG TPA: secretin N-terminal domain-containing protein, partial [Acidobacteriota bacterium]|nr:secretin N-terminal domain-containing protein [Acidobacteriota bacterium]
MKRKKRLPFLASACLLLLLAMSAPGQDPVTTISRIEIQPGLLTTKLIFRTDALLPVQTTFYAPQQPRTIVIDVDHARTAEVPKIASADAPLIEDIRVERSGDSGLRFYLSLKEKVPYRISSLNDRTVVELNGIQKARSEYVIDPETRSRLDRKRTGEVVLDKLDISEQADRISFKARLGADAVSQVFALDNPSRLVVDLFDTKFAKPPAVYPVARLGVDRVRIGQFQTSDPGPITRIVFDLKEPGLYALDTVKDELVISFIKPGTEKVQVPAEAKKSEPAPVIAVAKAAPAPRPAEAVREQTAEPEPQTEAPRAAQEDKFKPKTIANDEEKYTGEIISLKFKDADLRDVVLYLADFADLNVVFDPDVRGTVTCDLRAVPWDQALDIVLRYNRMGKSIEGNVLRIAPVSVLTNEDAEQRRLKESKELSGPVLVKTITLSYSKAKDVSALLKSKVSSRGEIVIDERTNTLIISEVREKLDLIEKLITVLDTPTPQVSIEARIIEASSTFIRNLGIQWG